MLAEVTQTIPRRMETIRAYQARGGRIAAVFPIHYPRALFRAFDILPVEVWGPPSADASLGARRLQPYICSIVRNGLAYVESGGLDVADVLVVPHGCDSLQGLASVLIDFVVPRQPVLPIYLPRGRRPSDREYLEAELRALYERLAAIVGQAPDEAALAAAMAREEAADALLAELHARRLSLPLDNLGFYRLVRSREYLPAERFAELARAALAEAADRPAPALPIVLSGIVPEPMEVLALLDELGATVAADDLACCGRRLYPPGAGDEPFARMAGRILDAPPDPTRGTPIPERIAHLTQMVERTGARGIIFYDVKFCEPELFDLPDLRRALQAAGIPSLAVEADIGDPLSGQLRTRVESFLEMVA